MQGLVPPLLGSMYEQAAELFVITFCRQIAELPLGNGIHSR